MEKAVVKLSDFSILHGLDEADLSFLSAHTIQKVYEPGERLIREEEINADLMFVLDGCVQLSNGDGLDKVVLREEQGGVVLGELSFLDNSPRSLSVTALKRTRVIVLPRAVFVGDDPQSLRLQHQIERNIALISTQRLRDTSEGFVQSLGREVNLLREQVN